MCPHAPLDWRVALACTPSTGLSQVAGAEGPTGPGFGLTRSAQDRTGDVGRSGGRRRRWQGALIVSSEHAPKGVDGGHRFSGGGVIPATDGAQEGRAGGEGPVWGCRPSCQTVVRPHFCCLQDVDRSSKSYASAMFAGAAHSLHSFAHTPWPVSCNVVMLPCPILNPHLPKPGHCLCACGRCEGGYRALWDRIVCCRRTCNCT